MSDEDSDEKPHEATQRKLEQARERGELPRSADLTATAAMAGFAALALLPGGWAPVRLGAIGAALLERADPLSQQMLRGGTGAADALFGALVVALAPLFALPALAVVALLVAIRGLVFAPEKLKPKASRISPIANARNKFGPAGLFEFAKSTVKLGIYALVLWVFLAARLPRLIAATRLNAGQAVAEMMRLIVEFLVVVVAIMALIGAIDYVWQQFDHRRRQRMSHQELRDEHKQVEGDPHMKQARRQRAREIATNSMLADVATASVVIVNPTHYAIALRWDRTSPGAPVCVAKGVDPIAARIRDRAQAAGVPIHADAPTARALHAATEIGQEVTPEHYAPVAAAIRFAELMRQKARARGQAAPGPGNVVGR
ncbi:MAG: flagellar biosynthetic protein FlhB [Rhodobacteraceae bacterium HLUCCA12]|nr:MAG: flagellar biosynthetic protein FlhB [Rhodobacteraceae bacterium HLUCCA12]